MASLTERMVGAAKLDVHTYEEVEADTTATGQALGVVVLSSVAAGIGGSLGALGEGNLGFVVGYLIGYTVVALIGWVIWAFVTYIVGTKLLPEPATKSDMGELLRTTGFSQAPGLLRVVGAVPFLGPILSFLVNIWMLVAFVIAVRQALDYQSTWRAIGVCVIGWVIQVVFVFVLAGILMAVIGIGAAAGAGG
ncbi:YIP1 family protein [Acidobacteriia bacterium AH_259_A11_L15]|nr:YIP1 family protein [Acidobacteriia bacterium AH_259_A11_L15]